MSFKLKITTEFLNWEYDPKAETLSGVVHNSIDQDRFSEGAVVQPSHVKHRSEFGDHSLFKLTTGEYVICYHGREKRKSNEKDTP